jgi:hypothetical protein
MKQANDKHWDVTLPATYCSEWKDGYGVRGWKLDVSIGDPAVIVSTEETGRQIPTSVFVHDIVDHHLCGLPMSGHRNEAIALNLLAERTGSSPLPDYTQMVEEDILLGSVNGEDMTTFLPESLASDIPEELKGNGRLMIQFLSNKLGSDALKNALIEHFQTLGEAGYQKARSTWLTTGLDFQKRKQIGFCIQKLLEESSPFLKESVPEVIHADIRLSNDSCSLLLKDIDKEFVYNF